MRRVGVTLVKRVCSFCAGNEGFRLWPWSGRVFVTTHTLCRRCAQRHGLIGSDHARRLGGQLNLPA